MTTFGFWSATLLETVTPISSTSGISCSSPTAKPAWVPALPDATTTDLTGDQGKAVRIDAGSQLSEDSADQWMRQVQTKPADFLKSRFAIEAAR